MFLLSLTATVSLEGQLITHSPLPELPVSGALYSGHCRHTVLGLSADIKHSHNTQYTMIVHCGYTVPTKSLETPCTLLLYMHKQTEIVNILTK